MFNKFKTFAQLIGFITLGLLALYGSLALLDGDGRVQAAKGEISPAPQLGAAAAPANAPTALDTVPTLINYQGTLRDLEGALLSGVVTLTFRLYNDIVDPAAIWTEEHTSVTVRQGHFSVLLGGNNPLTQSLFDNQDRYIGVTIAPYDELVPRQRLVSVPYAIQAENAKNAENADTATQATQADNAALLAGQPASAFAPANLSWLAAADGNPTQALRVDNSGKVGIGTTGPVVASLHIASGSDSSLSSGGYLVSGSTSGGNIAIDNNEIMARNNGSAAPLFLNHEGGQVQIGDSDAQNITLEQNKISAHNNGSSATLALNSQGDPVRIGSGTGQNIALEQNEISAHNNGSSATLTLNSHGDPVEIGGDLTVSGDITNFTLSQTFTGAGPLISSQNSICFLTMVYIGDTNSTCEINDDGSQWQLTYSGAGSKCYATCLSW